MNREYERFKTFLYKNSVPKENGEMGACIDSDFICAYVKQLFDNIDMKICKNCKYKRDTDINNNKMNDEYFCQLTCRCESIDFGCNRFELRI